MDDARDDGPRVMTRGYLSKRCACYSGNHATDCVFPRISAPYHSDLNRDICWAALSPLWLQPDVAPVQSAMRAARHLCLMQLITGGTGFIGQHVARALLEMGEECVLTVHRAAPDTTCIGEWVGTQAFLEPLDVTDQEAFIDVGRRRRITGIIHLAGPSLLTRDPFQAAHEAHHGLLNAFLAARAWGVSRVSVASSIGVYGGALSETLREDALLPLATSHVIPAFKKISEILCSYVGSSTGLEIVSLRISAVWGPRGRADSSFFSLPRLVHAAVRGQSAGGPGLPRIFADDGSDLCYVKDCGRAIALIQLARKLNHQTYNVGSGRAVTNRDVALALEHVIPGARVDLGEGFDPSGPGHAMALDISRLREDAGFEPMYDIERGIADYVAWLRAGHER